MKCWEVHLTSIGDRNAVRLNDKSLAREITRLTGIGIFWELESPTQGAQRSILVGDERPEGGPIPSPETLRRAMEIHHMMFDNNMDLVHERLKEWNVFVPFV